MEVPLLQNYAFWSVIRLRISFIYIHSPPLFMKPLFISSHPSLEVPPSVIWRFFHCRLVSLLHHEWFLCRFSSQKIFFFVVHVYGNPSLMTHRRFILGGLSDLVSPVSPLITVTPVFSSSTLVEYVLKETGSEMRKGRWGNLNEVHSSVRGLSELLFSPYYTELCIFLVVRRTIHLFPTSLVSDFRLFR